MEVLLRVLKESQPHLRGGRICKKLENLIPWCLMRAGIILQLAGEMNTKCDPT